MTTLPRSRSALLIASSLAALLWVSGCGQSSQLEVTYYYLPG